MANIDRRATIFPRTKTTVRPQLLKRTYTNHVASGKGAKLQRLAPIRGKLRIEAENPWRRFRKVFKFDQAGTVILVHKNDDFFEEFVAKTIKTSSQESLFKIKDCSHRNIIRLHEALYDNGAITFIYEVMEVSLAHIFMTPLGRLKPYEVAAFCTELLNGLDYIHNHLQLIHGDLTAESVLLSMNGVIKIANIGSVMLQRDDQKNRQDYIRALGNIMLMCLEPRAHLQKHEDLQEDWNSDLVDFHKSTKSTSLQEILKHDFLKLSPGPKCLNPYIRVAREVIIKDIEIV